MWWIAILAVLLLRVFWPTARRRVCVRLNLAQKALQARNWPMVRSHLDIARAHIERLKEQERACYLGPLEVLAANADYREGKFFDCETHLNQAAALIEKVKAPSYQMQMAEIHRMRGDICFDRGQTEAAADHFRGAVAADQTIGNDGLTIFDLQRLSDVLLDQRRFDEAKSVVDRAVELERKVIVAGLQKEGKDPARYTTISMSMPDLALATGDWAQAEKLFREKVDRWSKMVTAHDNIDVTRYQFHLASALREQGRSEEAITTLRRACERVTHDFGADHPRMARALEKLSNALNAAGNETEAAEIIKQAEALRARR